MIGDIIFENYMHTLNNTEILETLKTKKLHLLFINFQTVLESDYIYDYCIAGSNFYVSHLNIIIKYDENFHEIKRLEYIDRNIFKCYGIAVSKTDRIFITDCERHCIHRLDLDLVKNRTFGGYGMSSESEFFNPKGICCKDRYLCVCDYGNQRINLMNLDFESFYVIQLDVWPESVRIVGQTMGITTSNGLYFYDLNTGQVKLQDQRIHSRRCGSISQSLIKGTISEIDSYFFVTAFKPTKMFLCFDSNGTFIEQILINKDNENISDWKDGSLVCLKKDIYMLSYSQRRIIKFL
jgi:hypothetical protein